MYDKVSTNLEFVSREKEILKFWKENEIFEKSVQAREGAALFTFYDGPPTANGKPHVGHLITRAVKDLIPRYKTMKGYKVLRKAGWDTHGLPVELEVEKSLGISGKPQIEDYGVEPFIKKCKDSVFVYEKEWRDISDAVGYWVDMNEPYVTYKNEYIESVWWAIKSIADKGLLYKGHKIVPYCPRCGTALSSHEVAQGYKDVTETSVFAKFKVKGKDNEYFLAWTTTPWTLPSNVALTVNANETYAKVESGGEIFIMAKALLDTVLKAPYTLLSECKGQELEYTEYEPLFDFTNSMHLDKKAFYITCDDYVTLTDGTGIVHSAPAFGEEDARVGRKYDLPFVQFVDAQGKFIEDVYKWKGIFVKDADRLIIQDLEDSKKLYKDIAYTHSYPFCWRCDTPLIYYARSTWFIEMTKLRDELVKNNNTVNWLPDNIREGRFGNFLENVVDWSLSRERYWGTPLPVWLCECGHREVIGSIAELKEKGLNVPHDIELHKPYIDQVRLQCPHCQKEMERTPEVVDCWFDSGAMPFAQWHYPFENKEIFEQNFPADFISEAVDQTRGWFYSLIAISTILFEKSPYKNVIVLGLVQDKNGQKMSKHKGNGVDPWESLSKQGADAVRWYFYVNSAPWLPSRFYDEAVNEVQRKFMGTFWNSYAFYVLYANIDGFDPSKYTLAYEKLSSMDKWVLSKLHSLIQLVDTNLAKYKITETAREMQSFVEDVSNWYVRRSRERFWGSDMSQDKINAYMTLYTVLTELSKISAPFIPFMTEAIYQNIVRRSDQAAPESIHLCDFPTCNTAFIDKPLEESMSAVLDVVVLGRAARNTANIKNRQPIGKMVIKTANTSVLSPDYVTIIADELNVKTIEFADDVEQFVDYKFKPQLRTVGPKYGKLVGKIGNALANENGQALMKQLKDTNEIHLTVEDTAVVLTQEDVLVETVKSEQYVTVEDKGYTVVMHTVLTEELIEEGFIRELISKIQTMRKEAGFEVLDRIVVYHEGSERLAGIFARNQAAMQAEVLAVDILPGTADGYRKDWSINGEPVSLTVVRK